MRQTFRLSILLVALLVMIGICIALRLQGFDPFIIQGLLIPCLLSLVTSVIAAFLVQWILNDPSPKRSPNPSFWSRAWKPLLLLPFIPLWFVYTVTRAFLTSVKAFRHPAEALQEKDAMLTRLFFFLPKERRDAFLGDLFEECMEKLETQGDKKARRFYLFQVISSFWPLYSRALVLVFKRKPIR